MAKEEKRARLRYEKDTDTFYIEIWDDEYNEWGLDMSQKCQKGVYQKKEDEPELLHFSMLKEMVKLAELGYDIHLARTN